MTISQVQQVGLSEDMNGVIKGWEDRGFVLHQVVPLNDGKDTNYEGNGNHATAAHGFSYTRSVLLVFRKEQ